MIKMVIFRVFTFNRIIFNLLAPFPPLYFFIKNNFLNIKHTLQLKTMFCIIYCTYSNFAILCIN